MSPISLLRDARVCVLTVCVFVSAGTEDVSRRRAAARAGLHALRGGGGLWGDAVRGGAGGRAAVRLSGPRLLLQ